MARRLLPLVSALFALTLLLPAGAASANRAGRHAALPAVAKTQSARAVRKSDKRIEKFRQHYLAKAKANRLRPSAREAKQEAQFAADAAALAAELNALPDQRPVLIILEGPDGAGKSSTIRRLRTAFDGAFAVREVHFGAPKGETGHWLDNYRKELPRQGEVVFWDRSYYGRVVYDPYYGQVDDKVVRNRYGDIERLEGQLKDSVRVVKFFLDARGERLAKTIGKREALEPDSLEKSDYETFRDRKAIRNLFTRAIKKTSGERPWHKVSMSDRRDARGDMLKILRRELVERAGR